MNINFTKMQGAGNHYIYITHSINDLSQDTIANICNPYYGIGSDGVVLLRPSHIADAHMTMYNNDGSRGNICGNALRCVTKLLYEHSHRRQYTIQCDSGTIHTEVIDNTHYTVHMPTATVIDTIDVSQHTTFTKRLTLVNVGNDHAVAIGRLSDIALNHIATLLNEHYLYYRYNIELAEVIDRTNVNAIVYEKGSGTTQSCGSGAIAVMATLHQLQLVEDTCHIHMPGGTLTTTHLGDHYSLSGDAYTVYQGTITI